MLEEHILVPIDVDELLQQENLDEAKKIAEDSRIIREISEDLTDMLGDQGEQIDIVDCTIEDTKETLDDANDQLEKARKSFFRSKLCKFTLIGIVVGLVVGFIVGIIITEAAKLNIAICTIVGVILGGVIGGMSSFSIVKWKLKR